MCLIITISDIPIDMFQIEYLLMDHKLSILFRKAVGSNPLFYCLCNIVFTKMKIYSSFQNMKPYILACYSSTNLHNAHCVFFFKILVCFLSCI